MKKIKDWKNTNLLINSQENNFTTMRFLDFKYNYPQAARDAGFKLKPYKNGPIDWRLISSLEVYHLAEEQNFEQIDGALEHLAEVPLGCLLNSNVLESGIVKYFMLAQYSIQYLLFCREFLEDTIGDLKESNDSAQKQIAGLKQSLTDSNHQILRLHRKVTEIENLHEVIYPCHLCTKNFISNEALSLHLCRKHPESLNRRTTALTSDLSLMPADGLFCNSQDCDQALINTIKLELELKHLKERLTQTEREVKERNLNVMLPISTSDHEKIRTFQNIAIQSNLTDMKEIDESKEDEVESSYAKDETFVKVEEDNCNKIAEDVEDQEAKLSISPPTEDNVLIQQLEQQLHNFEEWKKNQQKQNENFMMTVQEKLQNLTLAVEHQIKEKQTMEESVNAIQESTVPELEKLLNTKMEKMTSMNMCKLEEIVLKMNTDYNNRLEQLQKNLSNYMQASVLRSTQNDTNEIDKNIITNKNGNQSTAENGENSAKDKNQNLNTVAQIMVAATSIKPIPKQVVTEVQVKQVKELSKDQIKRKNNLPESSSEEKETSNDETIISEMSSLEDIQQIKENVDVTMKEMSKTFIINSNQKKESSAHYRHRGERPRKIKKNIALIKENPNIPNLPKIELLTRTEIRKMVNNRLKPFGLNIKIKNIPEASLKRTLQRIQESRNLMQNNDPQFTSTRNKLKRCVDKLCCNKLPTNVKTLLRETNTIRQKMMVEMNDNVSSSSNQSTIDNRFSENSTGKVEQFYDKQQKAITSTPEIDRDNFLNDDLKARLKRILASPIKQPESYQFHMVKTTKAVVHRDRQDDNVTEHVKNEDIVRPVPLPRKKVMFEQPMTINGNP